MATLRTAASIALGRGAPETAAAYLRRALDEPPAKPLRADVLLEFALAEMVARRDPWAVERLRDAIARIDMPSSRAAAALRAGRALGTGGHYWEAAAILESVPDPGLRIEAELAASGLQLASHASSALARLARRRDARPTDGGGWRLMQVMLAHRSVIAGEHHSVAEALLDRALAGPGILGEESLVTVYAAMDLVLIDRLDDAERLCATFIEEGRRRGSLSIISSFSFALAFASLRRGRLRDSEAHGQLALDGMLALVPRSDAGAPWALAFLVDALTERGDTAGADKALARLGQPAADPSEMLAWAFLLTAQGRLRIAQGHLRDGLADLREAGARWERLNCRTPTTRWREDAALALAQLGEQAEAQRLAAEQLDLARAIGLPREIGAATALAGALAPRSAGIPLLRRGVGLLAQAPAPLDLARALLKLGAALRREGHRVEARDHLR